jgi:hypothetical protein
MPPPPLPLPPHTHPHPHTHTHTQEEKTQLPSHRATFIEFDRGKGEAVNDDLVSGVLDEERRDKAQWELEQEEEEERQRSLQQSIAEHDLGSGLVSLEGKLDKRSPATGLWQNRYFKLSTRQIPRADGAFDRSGAQVMDYFYSLIWFKKKGGAALKDVDSRYISGMSLMQSSRKLCYDAEGGKVELLFGSVGGGRAEVVARGGADFDAQQPSVGTAQLITLATGSSAVTYFSFSIHTSKDMGDEEAGAGTRGGGGGDKDILLRTKSVDDMIEWLNTIAQTAQLAYDADSGVWARRQLKAEAEYKKTETAMASASLEDINPHWSEAAAAASEREAGNAREQEQEQEGQGQGQGQGQGEEEQEEEEEEEQEQEQEAVRRPDAKARRTTDALSPKEVMQQVKTNNNN